MALTSHVHPRLGLPNFLKFESYFLAALEAWPNETEFTITGLSPTTTCARMRDSLLGYRLNAARWETQVNPRFIELYKKYEHQWVISLQQAEDGTPRVWFRHRKPPGGQKAPVQYHEASGHLEKHIRSRTVVSTDGAVNPSDDALVLASMPSVVEIRGLADMKAKGIITKPIIFPGKIDPAESDAITASFDLALSFDPSRNVTVMI